MFRSNKSIINNLFSCLSLSFVIYRLNSNVCYSSNPVCCWCKSESSDYSYGSEGPIGKVTPEVLRTRYGFLKAPALIWTYNKDTVNVIRRSLSNKALIYAWVNRITGKVYVGSTVDGGARPFVHMCFSGASNPRLQRDLATFGAESFTLVVLSFVELPAGLSFEEMQRHLNLVESKSILVVPFMLLYNFKPFADRNFGWHTAEVRRAISERYTGERNPFYGRSHTPETLDHLSVTRKGEGNPFYGKSHTPETVAHLKSLYANGQSPEYRTICLTNINTNQQKLFESQSKARAFLGLTRSSMSRAVAAQKVINNTWKVERLYSCLSTAHLIYRKGHLDYLYTHHNPNNRGLLPQPSVEKQDL